MRVYLAGPINGCTDAEAQDWRAEATDRLARRGIGVFDPMSRDYRGRESEPGIAEIIVEQDKDDILAADIVLVYFEKPSVGTSMEVLYAYEHQKRVIIINKSGKPLSPWLKYHSDTEVTTLLMACEIALHPLLDKSL